MKKHSWNEPYHIVIEIENKRCKILKMLESLGIQRFKIGDIRGFTGGSIRHLVKLSSEKLKTIPKYSIRKIVEYKTIKKESIVWIESEGCDVCNAIISHGAFLISGRNTKDFNLIYSFIIPNFDAFKSLISALESNNLKVKVLKVEKLKLKKEILTDNQERILWVALKTGFFDYPRKVDSIELSQKLGISPSTLSEVIRRGVKRLLESYFEAS